MFQISNSTATGSLETPRVLPPVDSDETISSTSRDDLHFSPLIIPNTHTISHTYKNRYTPQPTARIISIEDSSDKKTPSKSNKLHVNISSAAEASLQTSNVISTPTPVITAGPSVTQSLGSSSVCSTALSEIKTPTLLGAQNAINGTTLIAPAPPTTSSASVPPSPSATVLQLLLRLPNGEAIPVEIPATPVVSSSGDGTTNTITSLATTSSSTNNNSSTQSSLAKIKLKQALASCSTAAKPGNSRNSRANTADRIAEMTRNRYHSGTSSNEGDLNDDNSESSLNFNSTSCKRRRSSHSDDDPMEKRKKFLERNRYYEFSFCIERLIKFYYL